jgi:very-short-patch-repair endonuclease
MSAEDQPQGTSATSSLPSGEGWGGVRRDSAVRSAREALARLPPVDLPRAAPWGRPDATATVETARALRKRLTPQEAKLWLRLRALRPQGFHFRRQVPTSTFIVDFACLKAGVVVEVDGGQHGAEAHLAKDRRRDVALAAAGFEVLRFWNAEVDADPDAVTETIFARLTTRREAAARLSRPQPSPAGREGGGAPGEGA